MYKSWEPGWIGRRAGGHCLWSECEWWHVVTLHAWLRHDLHLDTAVQSQRNLGREYDLQLWRRPGWRASVRVNYGPGRDALRPDQGRRTKRRGSGIRSSSAGGVRWRVDRRAPAFFPGGKYGTAPYGPLALDQDGTLYGTAGGGTSLGGLVFGLEPPALSGNPWRASVIHTFGSPPSGRIPAPGLVIGSGRVIYGATEKGGQDVPGFCYKPGCGTVFELLPPAAPGGSWTESLIHAFTCGNDGCQPASGLVQGPDGFIYGTTRTGGDSGEGGTVYQVQP